MDKAAIFHGLHGHGLLMLANAWDCTSARLAEEAGAPAIATTSAGLAWTLGYRDGNTLPIDELLAAVKRICRVVKAPVSVDVEGGYADTATGASTNVSRVIDAGAVGINIEDGSERPEFLAAKIEAIREMAVRRNLDLFINARTDLFLAPLVPVSGRVREAIRRAEMYRAAGASGLFIPGATQEADIAEIARGTKMPLNVMERPGLPAPARLEELGVRRLSAGSGIAERSWNFVRREIASFLGQSPDADGRLDYRALNALLV